MLLKIQNDSGNRRTICEKRAFQVAFHNSFIEIIEKGVYNPFNKTVVYIIEF